jgi:hypothetical protein
MMTKPHPHQEHYLKGLIIPLITALLFSLCTSSTTKQKRDTSTNKSTLFKKLLRQNYLKLKTKTENVMIKKYADLTTKEKI